jgi:hypothetical protein
VPIGFYSGTNLAARPTAGGCCDGVQTGTELTVCVRSNQNGCVDHKRWYEDDDKRMEVVVWFLERRVNRSRRKEPGTLTERLERVKKRLKLRNRGRDYDDIMKILWVRAEFGGFGGSYAMARLSGLRIGTVKQTLRRLDRVAHELFRSESY